MAKLGKPAAAMLIMAAIIAVLLTLCTPRSTSRSSSPSAAGADFRARPGSGGSRGQSLGFKGSEPLNPP